MRVVQTFLQLIGLDLRYRETGSIGIAVEDLHQFLLPLNLFPNVRIYRCLLVDKR
jgi:hypothetical protein